MWRLIRSRNDRGAVTLLVALVVPAIMLILGGVVITVGQWYSSRAQTQNGSDSAAQAVAITCAKSACNTAAATPYAPANANSISDTQISAGFPCGHDSNTSGAHLPSCNPAFENGRACPATHPTNYVEVQTITVNQVGVIPGGQTKVASCAVATWGPRSGGNGIAIGMSLCAWQQETGGVANPTYATPAPPYPASGWPAGYPKNAVNKNNPVVSNPAGENVVQIHGDAKPCNDSSSGLNLPGGFGFLQDTGNNCTTTTDVNQNVPSDPGNNISNACKAALQAIYDASSNGKTIPNSLNPLYVPVFDKECASNHTLVGVTPTTDCGTMPSSSYHIAGYASFVLTGYDIGPVSNPSLITGKSYCKGSFTCMEGLFIKGLVSAVGNTCDTNCGPDLGAPVVVKLTG